MNKPTLIENTYYESDHTYLVTIGTDMGEFTGCAQCEPADYDYESRYFGWELAEIKANLQYARAKRKYYIAQSFFTFFLLIGLEESNTAILL